jgi:hypothetical protein
MPRARGDRSPGPHALRTSLAGAAAGETSPRRRPPNVHRPSRRRDAAAPSRPATLHQRRGPLQQCIGIVDRCNTAPGNSDRVERVSSRTVGRWRAMACDLLRYGSCTISQPNLPAASTPAAPLLRGRLATTRRLFRPGARLIVAPCVLTSTGISKRACAWSVLGRPSRRTTASDTATASTPSAVRVTGGRAAACVSSAVTTVAPVLTPRRQQHAATLDPPAPRAGAHRS